RVQMLIHTSDTHCPHCETAVSTDNTSCPNCGKLLMLDNLRFVRRIGSGGFGEVYEAININLLGAKRAVKVIPIAKYSPDEWKFLIDYSRDCHFIPDIYDLKQPAKSENIYIVMEFIEGVSLEKTIPPPWDTDHVEVFLEQLLQHLNQMHNLP